MREPPDIIYYYEYTTEDMDVWVGTSDIVDPREVTEEYPELNKHLRNVQEYAISNND